MYKAGVEVSILRLHLVRKNQTSPLSKHQVGKVDRSMKAKTSLKAAIIKKNNYSPLQWHPAKHIHNSTTDFKHCR